MKPGKPVGYTVYGRHSYYRYTNVINLMGSAGLHTLHNLAVPLIRRTWDNLHDALLRPVLARNFGREW